MRSIELKFDKSQTRLAGFPYGEKTFKNQVKKHIQNGDSQTSCYKIIFPVQIEKVASSFVQGFFSELINSIGYEEIERQIIIEASNDILTKKIIENIY